MNMIEQIVHHLVLEPLEVGTPGNIRWTSEPHPLCTKVREELELVLDYIPDDSYDSGYRDGELFEEITDPYILDLIDRVESLPCIYKTESGVSLHRDNGVYYLGWHVDCNRRLWYRVHERYSDELDALVADLYAAIYNRVEHDMARRHIQEKLQRVGLWGLVSERLDQ